MIVVNYCICVIYQALLELFRERQVEILTDRDKAMRFVYITKVNFIF